MELWSEVRRRVLTGELSKRQACQKYQLHWDTLAKILRHEEPPGYRKKQARPKPVLGPFVGLIHEILEADKTAPKKQRHTAKRILERLREQGYRGGRTVVQEEVRRQRQRSAEVFMPLVHRPGEAQADFGEATVVYRGQARKAAMFVMSLPFSDAVFCQIFPRECTETFQEGHRRAFEFFGAVPTRISYDNTKIAVSKVIQKRGGVFNRVLVGELLRGEYIDRRESVILVGNPGTGKTHLAIVLGMTACAQGKRVRFWRVTELITQLMEVREERQLMRMKSQLAKLDVLILDELGYVPASKLGSELLFDVISTAYERTSVIVTTNLPFEQWTEVLGSERLTGAVLDRLTHRCHIPEATGESYRLKDARRRASSRSGTGKRAAETPAKPPEKEQSGPAR
jgi:DNA replication protein DnaC